MKIIIDANIIFSNTLIKENLPQGVTKFLNICAEKGHEIMIALTTKLEFERKQRELREKEINELRNAVRALEKYNYKIDNFDPEKLISEPNLIDLIQKCNVKVQLVHPDFDDFMYAHEKACLHLSPHPPDAKSDEMRDLIVWRIALKIASQESGGMVLISNDQVHTHWRGDEEALGVGLVRVKSLEAALEYLNVDTPNGLIIKRLLENAWGELIQNGIQVKEPMELRGLNNVKFIQGEEGPTQVSFKMKAIGTNDKDFISDVTISIVDNFINNILLDNINIDNAKSEKIKLKLNLKIEPIDSDYEQRLDALKSILNANL